jgi:hypothetical protein
MQTGRGLTHKLAYWLELTETLELFHAGQAVDPARDRQDDISGWVFAGVVPPDRYPEECSRRMCQI